MSGREGLQLALLAPGWVHGSLGLWITLRRADAKTEYLLIAWLMLVPALAAIGFFRMAADLKILGVVPQKMASGAEAVILASWKDSLIMAYLGALAVAILLGRLHRLSVVRGDSRR